MSVYVDDIIGCLVADNWNWTRVAHLMADTEKELIAFGKRIGCKSEWLQHGRLGIPHFDVTIRMRDKAIKAGAIEIDRKKVVKLMQKYRRKK
jgi:ethanolamine utilization microcompartment shell protein EutS